jgi:hypothetical protein
MPQANPNLTFEGTLYLGSQLPRTGNKFAGFFTFSNNTRGVYREYLQTKLITALEKGERYCVELFVSLASNSDFAANNLGLYFYKDPLGSFGDSVLPFTPQIESKEIIQDTLNWVRISTIFTADDNYKYLIIGNFRNDNDTQSIHRPPQKGYFVDEAYYFIDDVSIIKLLPKSFVLEGDTAICKGSATHMMASGLDNIKWSTLEDTTTIIHKGGDVFLSPGKTTSYLVRGNNCDLIVRDTITVNVHPLPEVFLGEDTTICKGMVLKLDAGMAEEYGWSDHTYERFIDVSKAGNYWVRVKNAFGCYGQDEIVVSVEDLPVVNLGKDTLVCNGLYPLHAGRQFLNYSWSTGSTDSVLTPTSPGMYWVSVENHCGVSVDTINIYSLQNVFIPNVLTLNPDDNINSKFQVEGISSEIPARLIIYNKWGKEIYKSSFYQNDWPAETNELSSGIYYYILIYRSCPPFKGWIHIIK